MATTSADPEALDAFAGTSEGLNTPLGDQAVALQTAYETFLAAPNDVAAGAPSQSGTNPPRLEYFGETVAAAGTHRQDRVAEANWATVVATAFRQAGSGGDIRTLDDSVIDARLAASGLPVGAPALITVEAPSAAGLVVDSGFKDDPVNAGSGNFVEPELDLAVPSPIWPMRWLRNYNSRFRTSGPMGRGWSSWATTRLDLTGGGARYAGPDGQVVELARHDDGRYEPSEALAAEVVEQAERTDLRWAHGERWQFHPDGHLEVVDLGAGNLTSFEHDHRGRLVAMVHAAGRRHRIHWHGDRIGSVEAGDGRRVTYRYNARGDLVGAEGPAGARRYEVDERGLALSVTDGDGVVLARNTYDVDGRVLAQESARGLRTTYQYAPGPVSTITDGEDGPSTVFFHDPAGRLTGAIDDHGHRLTRRFQGGRPVSVRDRLGRVTGQEFDARSRLVRRVLPDGTEERWTYDGDHLVALTGPDGARVRLEYDDDDPEPSRVIDPEGAVTTIEAGERAGDGRRCVTITDPDGVVFAVELDAENQAVATVDGLGHRADVGRDAAGRVNRLRQPGGQEQRWTYDDAGRPVVHTAADGAETRARWSPAGRLVAVTAADGATVAYERDGAGHIDAVTDPSGAALTFRHDPLGNLVGIAAADGAKFELTYDGLRRLTGVHDPAGGVRLFEHDAGGQRVASVDGDGRRVSEEHDRRGRVRARTDPAGHTTGFERDAAGRVTVVTAPDGSRTTSSYDRCGRLVAVTDGEDRTTRFEYTPAGRLRRRVAPSGAAWSWEYDGAGRMVAAIAPGGATTRYRRDANGWVTAIAHPSGAEHLLGRDVAGRVIEHRLPGGAVARYAFDSLGRVVETTGADGGVRRFRYDRRGLLVEAVDPTGGVTHYGHDERGVLVAATDSLGGTVAFHRDLMGRLVGSTDQLGRASRIDRRPSGAVRAVVDGTGRRTEVRADAAGRVVERRSGDLALSVERDGAGRVVSTGDGTGRSELAWDRSGRLVERRRLGSVLSWRYDADGLVAAIGYPDGSEARFAHDAAGRLLRLSHPALGEAEIGRDPAGRRRTLRAAGPPGGMGIDRTWRYDGAGRLVVYRDGDEVTELRRDGAGRVVEERSSAIVWRYRYGPGGALAEADGPAGSQRYRYDPAGRLAEERGPAGTTTYTYDRAHQLVAADGPNGRTTYAYDGAGRRIAEVGPGRERRFRWDPFGRLASIATREPGGWRTTRFGVNAMGELVDVDGTALLWDPVGSIPAVRVLDRAPVLGRAEPLGMAGAGWLARGWDATVGGSGPDPWGAAGAAGAAGPRFGYRGELEVDGLLWLRRRVYDPATRSFLSPDPIPGRPGSATVANPYHYAHHDPVGHVDPLGLQPLSDAEWEAWQEAHPTGIQQVGNFVEDHWDEIAAVAVVATGVALCFVPGGQLVGGVMIANATIGGGILIGAGATAATQLVTTGELDARGIALGGLVGGATAGMGGYMAPTLRSAAAAPGASPLTQALGHNAVTTYATTGVATGVTGGTLNETIVEPGDTNPYNDAISFEDIAADGLLGGTFGATRGLLPHADEVLDLRLPQSQLDDWADAVGFTGSLEGGLLHAQYPE